MKRFVILPALLALTSCDLPVRVGAPGSALAADRPTEACVLPAVLPAPELEHVRLDEVVADRPILFHMLAVTWMPETCRTGGDGQGDLACSGDNRFGWTLHGLWPN